MSATKNNSKMIQDPEKVWNGILFVGDPHMGIRPPATRTDEAFHHTVEKKLIQAGNIATKKNLFPVILGDLINRNNEYQPEMFVSLLNALKSFPCPPRTILGNHDRKNTTLGKTDTLFLFKELGLLSIMPNNGFSDYIVCEKPGNQNKSKDFFHVFIGGTSNGYKIPKNVVKKLESFKQKTLNELDDKENTKSLTVWITHHDINFLQHQSWYKEEKSDTHKSKNSSRPHSDEWVLQPHEIQGVDWVVNGHLHKSFEPVIRGNTKWSNPGNITRMKINEKDHVPSVWEWSANLNNIKNKKLKRHKINYDYESFRAVVYADNNESEDSELNFNFVEELKADMLDIKTRDASRLKESVIEIFESGDFNKPSMHKIVWDLWKQIEEKAQ